MKIKISYAQNSTRRRLLDLDLYFNSFRVCFVFVFISGRSESDSKHDSVIPGFFFLVSYRSVTQTFLDRAESS